MVHLPHVPSPKPYLRTKAEEIALPEAQKALLNLSFRPPPRDPLSPPFPGQLKLNNIIRDLSDFVAEKPDGVQIPCPLETELKTLTSGKLYRLSLQDYKTLLPATAPMLALIQGKIAKDSIFESSYSPANQETAAKYLPEVRKQLRESLPFSKSETSEAYVEAVDAWLNQRIADANEYYQTMNTPGTFLSQPTLSQDLPPLPPQ